MATPESTNENWDALFGIEIAAGSTAQLRAASLCFRCKCTHGCQSLVTERDILGAQFWSVYVATSDAEKGAAVRNTLEQIDSLKKTLKAHTDTFEVARSASEIARINADGRVAAMLGVEGSHSVDNSLGVLRALRDLGVSYITLTSADLLERNESGASGQFHNRLTSSAELFVKEMNRLGMLVDISRLPPESVMHVVGASRSPVVASNLPGTDIAEKGRKTPNPTFDLIKKSGGVIMANFHPLWITSEGRRVRKDLSEAARDLRKKHSDDNDFRAALERWNKEQPAPNVTATQVAEYLDEIVNAVGVDHVGLSVDSGAIDPTPKPGQDVSIYRDVRRELRLRGFSGESIQKILGGNVTRVFQQAEAVAPT